MTRQSATRPEVRVGEFWLSTIAPNWGELVTMTRVNGDWQMSLRLAMGSQWRHPALVYGAPVEVKYGPGARFAGTLTEPDWDSGELTAMGASREAENALALDGSGNVSTAPNTVIDAAITRGVLSWTRVGDFGTTAVGTTDGLTSVRSVLDAWAATTGNTWHVNSDRQLVIITPAEDDPQWYVTPGSGALGSAADDRADAVFVRFLDSGAGNARATARYPAATPAGGIERALDYTGRPPMTATTALGIATTKWSDLAGRSGWTNGIGVKRGQVTTPGGVVVDPALIRAGDSMRLLGVRDVRGLAHHTDIVIGDTEYDWTEDDLQANPVGLAARDDEHAFEQIADLAATAMSKASGGIA